MSEFNPMPGMKIDISMGGYTVADEAARVQAEQERAQAEQARANAEVQRQSDETARQQNETARIQAEQERANAETARASEFDRLKRESETATDTANQAAERANASADNADRIASGASTAIKNANAAAGNATNAANLATAAAGTVQTVVDKFNDPAVTIETLPPGSNATADWTVSDGAPTLALAVPRGDAGKTAYEYAVADGYTGTESEFQAHMNQVASVVSNESARVDAENQRKAAETARSQEWAEIKPAAENATQAATDAAATANDAAERAENAAAANDAATEEEISDRSINAGVIVPGNLDYAVKTAMCDGKGQTWTVEEQAVARARLGQEEINHDHERRITNLEYAAKGYLYREETDASSAYEKVLPGDVCPWATLDKIGGRTLVWNQLLNHNFDDRDFWTSSGPQVEEVNGVLTQTPSSENQIIAASPVWLFSEFTIGHTCAITVDYKTGHAMRPIQINTGTTWRYTDAITDNKWHRSIIIIALEDNVLETYGLRFGQSTAKEDFSSASVKNPMIFDLTQMFGAETEPTAEQFSTMFPADYYPYSEPTLMTFSTDAVVSTKADDTDIARYYTSAIAQKYFPDGMKSAGSVHDEIDLERGVAIKRVGSFIIDNTYFWRQYGETVASYDSDNKAVFVKDMKKFSSDETRRYVTASTGASNNSDQSDVTSKTICIHSYKDGEPNWIVYHTSGTNDEVREYLSQNPIHVNYALLAPVESPITEFINTDIRVDAGGTLTFVNDQGDHYRVPVPNQQTWLVRLGGTSA